MHRLCRKRNRPVWHRFMHMPPACAIMIRSLSREKNDHSNGWSFFLEKVLRFDRKRLKVGHRLFRGVHFYLGGCKRQRGCKVNEIGIVENYQHSALSYVFFFVQQVHIKRKLPIDWLFKTVFSYGFTRPKAVLFS